MTHFDFVVIGGGPGGYAAAIRAAQLGMKTALVEKDKAGGTCLQRGCIPSKALFAAAELLEKLSRAEAFGIEVSSAKPSLFKMKKAKDEIVQKMTIELEHLIQSSGVHRITGRAEFKYKNVLEIHLKEGSDLVESESILIATGSRPGELPGLEFDGRQILSSDQILELETIPEKILIVGGGAIGVEFASFFAVLGCGVVLIETMPSLLPLMDREVSKRLEAILKRRGVDVHTETKCLAITNCGRPEADLSDGSRVLVEKVLICVGRRRNVEELHLDRIGVALKKDAILVDDYLETSVRDVYAIGDVTESLQLAHLAQAQGILVAENLKRPRRKWVSRVIPNCVYTIPEIAAVGFTEEEARTAGLSARVEKFLFAGLGKARVERSADGFIKLVIDDKSHQILGAHLICERATDLISELSLAMRSRVTIEDLAETIHPHPTFSEIISEAARAFLGSSVHKLPALRKLS